MMLERIEILIVVLLWCFGLAQASVMSRVAAAKISGDPEVKAGLSRI